MVGCSSGEEAYSLAIVFAEFLEQQGRTWPVQIFATDLNGTAVERARSGVFPKSIADRVSADRLRRYFYELDGKYRVAKAIRDMCVFAKHNVLVDPPFSRMDMISCRNMLIYLEPVLQQHLIPTLHYALKPSAVLLLGGSESTTAFTPLFEAIDAKHRVYAKKPSAVRLPTPLVMRPLGQSRATDDAAVAQELRRADGAQREAERTLLERYTPPGVLVTEDMEILQFHGDTSPYLAPLSGKASLNLVKMLREGLLAPIRAAIARAKKDRTVVRTKDVRVNAAGGYRSRAGEGNGGGQERLPGSVRGARGAIPGHHGPCEQGGGHSRDRAGNVGPQSRAHCDEGLPPVGHRAAGRGERRAAVGQ